MLVTACQTPNNTTSAEHDWVIVSAGTIEGVTIQRFEISATPVTNKQFLEFVIATGYTTQAEKNNTGGLVYTDRWNIDTTANWIHPQGKTSSIKNKMNHPVVMLTYNDINAYCEWAQVRLPTESEWKYACIKGNTNQSNINTNHWNKAYVDTVDHFAYTAPVKAFPPNELMIYSMLGNVWEVCNSPYKANSDLKVIKGGSFLCEEKYCRGYTPYSRQSINQVDSYFHVGFRVIKKQKREF